VILALCFFLSAAGVGLYMLWRHLKRRSLPKLAAVLHGFAGASGFGVLLATVVQSPTLAFARYALMVFIAAILLGVVNIVFHIRGKRHRTVLILTHGLTAVAGALTLLYGIILVATSEQPAIATTAKTSNVPSPSTSGSAATMSSALASTKGPASAQPEAKEAPAPTASAQTPPSSTGMPAGPAWADKVVTFLNDSSVLSGTAQTSLAAVAKDLQKHTEVTLVEVQGHADERGADEHNLELTQARASAVIDALVAAGVSRNRLRGVGYGASCPADVSCQATPAPAFCHQPASLQKSRRVVFLVLESGGERFHGKVVCDRGASLVPSEDQQYVSQ
jgi:outer membrane protein OmpA-like peptidoglycan-associated protein